MGHSKQPKLPKYWRLAEQFRLEMKQGVLKPGDRLPSLAEMKEQQGISRPTMEKVHSILEQDGLIIRQPGAGTFVLEPKKRETNGIIGITGFGFHFGGLSAYWSTLLEGVRAAATEAGVQVLLLDDSSSTGWEKADGVLICDWSNFETLRYVPPVLPCVSVLVPVEKMPSVAADDYAGAHAATGLLLTQGHRRIAYLHSSDHTVTPKRLAGYHAALSEAGIAAQPEWKRALPGLNDYGMDFVRTGKRSMVRWLKEDWRETGCTAILAQNDETAIGVMEAFAEAGWNVPQDVSVVGFDGLAIGQYVTPRLTTIGLPLRQIGAAAAEMLLRQIAEEEVEIGHTIFPVEVRVRESTAPPASS